MLAPDDMLQDRYQISYGIDDLLECVVYAAYDRHEQQPVLLAALPHEDDTALAATGALAAEVAHLQVEGLLTLQQHFVNDLTCYLVVDDPGGQDAGRALHSGTTLAALQDRASGTEDIARLERLLRVLEALHSREKPVLAGDLHASDIWIGADTRLYLSPVALLRPIGAGQTAYRATELEDAAAHPTPVSDVYAAGAVAYHLLTGWPPPAAAFRLAGTVLNPPRSLNAAVPPLLEQVVLRALQMSPAERYQSLADMRRALDAVYLLDGLLPEPAAPPPVLSPAGQPGGDTEEGPQTDDTEAEDTEPQTEETPAALPPQATAATVPAERSTCLIVTAVVLLVLLLSISAVGVYFLFGPGSTLFMAAP